MHLSCKSSGHQFVVLLIDNKLKAAQIGVVLHSLNDSESYHGVTPQD